MPSTSIGVQLVIAADGRTIARVRWYRESSRAAILRIGTRGSPLALAQAAWCATRWRRRMASIRSGSSIEVIRTSGDRIQDRPLAEAGGKGLFTKEIEEALLGRRDRPRGAFVEGHADRAARRA